jgi:hypothetical protein
LTEPDSLDETADGPYVPPALVNPNVDPYPGAFDELDLQLALDDVTRAEAAQPAEDLSWLEFNDEVSAPRTSMTRAATRGGAAVRTDFAGRNRVWWCDGEYVFFRRKRANPATLERHNKFTSVGNYVHVETQDDVEIYQLQEGSPFKRRALDLGAIPMSDVQRQAVLAACRRDYKTFIDCLSEISARLKDAFHEAFAKTLYTERLNYIFQLIQLRGGPTQVEIDSAVRAERDARGSRPKRMIYLPTGRG